MLCVHKAAVVYRAGWDARAPRVWQPCPSKSLSCLQLVEASWTPPVGDKQEVKAQVFRGSSQRTVDENPTVRLWLWWSGATIAGADWCESQTKFDLWSRLCVSHLYTLSHWQNNCPSELETARHESFTKVQPAGGAAADVIPDCVWFDRLKTKTPKIQTELSLLQFL